MSEFLHRDKQNSHLGPDKHFKRLVLTFLQALQMMIKKNGFNMTFNLIYNMCLIRQNITTDAFSQCPLCQVHPCSLMQSETAALP